MKRAHRPIWAIINVIVFTWLSVFNILCLEDYEWTWSENNGVLAIQYLINGVWHASTILLPMWVFMGTIGILTDWFKE